MEMSIGKVPQRTIIAIVVVVIIALAAFWLHSNAVELGLSPNSSLCGICH